MNDLNLFKACVSKIKCWSYRAILSVVLLMMSCSILAPSDTDRINLEDGLSILFIGNSLTYYNNMPGTLLRMLEYAEIEVQSFEVQAFPNYGLPDHWEMSSTRKKIASRVWDVVVLQQGPSATEGRPYLMEYSKLFAKEIRNAGGRPALYMVWPSQKRFFDFDGVSDSYRTAAELVDGLLFPGGEAWRVAWRKNPELALYGKDGFHPSELGSVLVALVMFEQLSRRDPHDLPLEILNANGNFEISEDAAKLLQDAAQEANAEFAR